LGFDHLGNLNDLVPVDFDFLDLGVVAVDGDDLLVVGGDFLDDFLVMTVDWDDLLNELLDDLVDLDQLRNEMTSSSTTLGTCTTFSTILSISTTLGTSTVICDDLLEDLLDDLDVSDGLDIDDLLDDELELP
jgi:hypothetical protein